MSFVVIEFSSLDNVGCDARSPSLSSFSQTAFKAGSLFNIFASLQSSYPATTRYTRCLSNVSMS